MKDLVLKICAMIFLLVGLLHLLRLILKINVVIGSTPVPLWMSAVGFVVPFLLSIWIFSLSGRK